MLTVAQVARIISCSPTLVRRRIKDGEIPHMSLAVIGDRSRWMVHRADLVRWLISVGWPAPKIRELVPLPGPLCLIGICQGDLADLGEPCPVYLRLFDFALCVERRRPWGAIFNLPELGSARTTDELRSYSKVVDRPVLIAIHGDDVAADDVFDVCIPSSLPSKKIVQRIQSVRPWK